jgi:hypothetical protein
MSNDVTNKILDAALEIVAQEDKRHEDAFDCQGGRGGTIQRALLLPDQNDLMIALLDRIQERFTEKRMSSVDLEKSPLKKISGGFFMRRRMTYTTTEN